MHTELDSSYIAQAVLVEEEEEEDAVRKGEDDPTPEPRPPPPRAPAHGQPVAAQREEPTAQETEPEAAMEEPIVMEELEKDLLLCALLPQDCMLVHLVEESEIDVAGTAFSSSHLVSLQCNFFRI